jgi:GTP-binding protein
VVDTGGIVFHEDPNDVFLPQIREQAMAALEESRAAILVVDGQAGPTTLDHEIASFLRREKLPVLLAVNKCESHTQGELLAAEFWELGLGTPWPVSGIHGSGLAELLDELLPHLETGEGEQQLKRVHCRVAIVGRPNVGKSSLLNRLCGKERAIVSDVAGTTRDTIDSTVEHGGKRYALVDTAGIRRKARVNRDEEKLMVNRAIKAIRRAQIVLLLIDALEGVTDQDMQLGELTRDAGAACVVVVNKWDLVDDERSDKMYRQSRDYLAQKLPTVAWASTLFISAKTGFNANRVYKAVDDALEQHERRVSTALLNEVLQEAVQWQKPPSQSTGRQGKIYYCTQVGRRPPAIAIFVNEPSLFPESYKRYLEGRFRDALGFAGTPLRLIFRGKAVREKGSAVPWAD